MTGGSSVCTYVTLVRYLFFFIRHADKCLCAEPTLDNAVRRMVEVRLVIPQHTSPLQFLHMVRPPVHSLKTWQKQRIPKCQEIFMSEYSLNPKNNSTL